jgi:hypothetical protein
MPKLRSSCVINQPPPLLAVSQTLLESACSAGGARLILPEPADGERRPEGNTANERLPRSRLRGL